MQSKDHLLLGKYILAQQNVTLSPIQKFLFLFGCIEPDLNPLTYTRGSLKHKFLHGHHAENAKRHLGRIIEKLGKTGIDTPKQWFVFGTALHYLADSFTFAHNNDFPGGLKEHRCYESLLHPVFVQALQQSLFHENSASSIKIDTMGEIHAQYQRDAHSFLTDCRYILRATANLCNILDIAGNPLPLPIGGKPHFSGKIS